MPCEGQVGGWFSWNIQWMTGGSPMTQETSMVKNGSMRVKYKSQLQSLQRQILRLDMAATSGPLVQSTGEARAPGQAFFFVCVFFT